jgi:hypothetical protein
MAPSCMSAGGQYRECAYARACSGADPGPHPHHQAVPGAGPRPDARSQIRHQAGTRCARAEGRRRRIGARLGSPGLCPGRRADDAGGGR